MISCYETFLPCFLLFSDVANCCLVLFLTTEDLFFLSSRSISLIVRGLDGVIILALALYLLLSLLLACVLYDLLTGCILLLFLVGIGLLMPF